MKWTLLTLLAPPTKEGKSLVKRRRETAAQFNFCLELL